MSHIYHDRMLPARWKQTNNRYKGSGSVQGGGVYQRNNCYPKPGHLVRKSHSILHRAHLALQDAWRFSYMLKSFSVLSFQVLNLIRQKQLLCFNQFSEWFCFQQRKLSFLPTYMSKKEKKKVRKETGNWDLLYAKHNAKCKIIDQKFSFNIIIPSGVF